MKRFDGILICTDLDGTLLRNDKTISEENLRAIEYFKREGGIFTFITGRMPFFVSDMYEAVKPNAPFGCINGGGLYDHTTGEYVWQRELDRGAFELVEDAAREVPGIGIQINTFRNVYFCRDNEAMVWFRRITGLPNLTAHHEDVTEPVAKIVFGSTREEEIAHLIEVLHAHARAEEFDFIRSEKALYEILPKGITKATALLKLSELLGIAPERTLGIGDYNNDIDMLRRAGVGVAVANAVPEAKAAADHITVSNEEHAIARVIADIESGVIRI